MSFYERLIDLIEKKNLTIRKIERECGLANASIRRWETQSPRLDSVVSVANYLQVSVDYLALGRCDKATQEEELNLEAVKQEQGLICDGSPLDNLEADLIAMFRLLPEEEQEDVFDIVHLKYKRRVERKRESIYWTYFDGSADEESGPAEGREARDGTA